MVGDDWSPGSAASALKTRARLATEGSPRLLCEGALAKIPAAKQRTRVTSNLRAHRIDKERTARRLRVDVLTWVPNLESVMADTPELTKEPRLNMEGPVSASKRTAVSSTGSKNVKRHVSQSLCTPPGALDALRLHAALVWLEETQGSALSKHAIM